MGGFDFFQVIRNSENFLGALGENLGLAGVVLLLDRRDRGFLFFCYASQQTCIKVKDTYFVGGTHEETQCPQSKARVRTRIVGTKSQPDKLWIHKTDTIIVQNKNGEQEVQASGYLSTMDYLNRRS